MEISNIAGIATALGTVIAAIGGAFSYYYNGKQKSLQESAKLEVEKNNREIRDLMASNKFLVEEIAKIRTIFKEVSESYEGLVPRIEGLELENKSLREENTVLRSENEKLHIDIAVLHSELAILKNKFGHLL